LHILNVKVIYLFIFFIQTKGQVLYISLE